jgi:hypothetical protein
MMQDKPTNPLQRWEGRYESRCQLLSAELDPTSPCLDRLTHELTDLSALIFQVMKTREAPRCDSKG